MGLGAGRRERARGRESNKIEMEVLFNQHGDNTKNLLVDDEIEM